MANALKLTGGDEVTETIKFVDKFDRFFDCVNVSSLSAGKLSRNPFKSPFRSPHDFRLKVKRILCAYHYYVMYWLKCIRSGWKMSSSPIYLIGRKMSKDVLVTPMLQRK